jgi:hypothetical protein
MREQQACSVRGPQLPGARPRAILLVTSKVPTEPASTTTAHAITVTGEDGRLIASVQALAFRTGRWHLSEEAWSRTWRETY